MGTCRKYSPLLGASTAIEELRDFIVGVSLRSEPVFLCGDPGTGKGLSAQKIHAVGSAPRAPLIRIACERFTESELRQLLFGRPEHGSSLDKSNSGVLGSPSGGTCYIAGIDLVSPGIIEAFKIYLVENWSSWDSGRPRLVFSSQKDLVELRDLDAIDPVFLDLISTYETTIPPLRLRIEDIPVLCSYQLWINSPKESYDAKWSRFQEELLEEMLAYHWPGNVEELNNAVRAYCTGADSTEHTWHQRSPSVVPIIEQAPALYLARKLEELHEELLHLVHLESVTGRNDLVIPLEIRERL